MKKFFTAVLLLCAALLLFAACAPASFPKEDTVFVAVEDNEGIEGGLVREFPRGSDAEIELTLREGYGIYGCDNGGYIAFGSGNTVKLLLRELNADARIRVSTGKTDTTITYMPNGGETVGAEMSSYTQWADTAYRQRANTNIGTGYISREGYTQTGWNTEADGSGEHVGLGSRVTLNVGGNVTLYAEWERWTDAGLFEYTGNNYAEGGGIVLTAYRGEKTLDTLCIPAEIDGKPVTAVAEGCAAGLNVQTLVFPNTLLTVDKHAFEGGRFGEIYFFDSLLHVSDLSFGGPIPKVHINAVRAPAYALGNTNEQFVESMDRLILHADDKKMIFFGGCSLSYGLNSPLAEEAFGGEYTVFNMGVNGETTATFQIECIMAYVREGDVFIHAPEAASPYQLLDKIDAEARIFTCVESNYDLLALADFSACSGFFDRYEDFNGARKSMPEYDYTNRNDFCNEYGDYIVERPNNADDTNFELFLRFGVDYVNGVSTSRLLSYYEALEGMGATVYFSYAPLNVNSLTEEDIASRIWEEYENRLRFGLGDRVISSVTDYLMQGKYFYDTDYHLTDEGAVLRTQMLVRDIKAAMAKGEGR